MYSIKCNVTNYTSVMSETDRKLFECFIMYSIKQNRQM
jgi:hypothetical protein